MKKLVFTVAAIAALSLTTKAQTEVKPAEPKKKEARPAATTTEAAPVEVAPGGKTKAEDPKKSGTRMAINEKGLPGEKKPKKETTNNPK